MTQAEPEAALKCLGCEQPIRKSTLDSEFACDDHRWCDLCRQTLPTEGEMNQRIRQALDEQAVDPSIEGDEEIIAEIIDERYQDSLKELEGED